MLLQLYSGTNINRHIKYLHFSCKNTQYNFLSVCSLRFSFRSKIISNSPTSISIYQWRTRESKAPPTEKYKVSYTCRINAS